MARLGPATGLVQDDSQMSISSLRSGLDGVSSQIPNKYGFTKITVTNLSEEPHGELFTMAGLGPATGLVQDDSQICISGLDGVSS